MKQQSTENQDMVNNSNLYLDETDSKGVPLLRRVEKYPNLPETEFIPIEYTHSDGQIIPKDKFFINKLGEVKNSSGYIYKGTFRKKEVSYLFLSLRIGNNYRKRTNIFIHRLVASTFLENPNKEIYKAVNHIDHNPENNKLSNLEWTTFADNSNRKDGKMHNISEDKLMKYIAIDDSGNELFSINKYNDRGYSLDSVIQAIAENRKHRGYYWKRSRPMKKSKFLELAGFSGNLSDYEWHEHWKYSRLYVCKEGFIKKLTTDKGEIVIGSLNNFGYVMIAVEENGKIRSKAVHRVIMEYILGRDLKDNEIVDHINTIRHDNRFDNLKLSNPVDNMNNPLTIEKWNPHKLVLCNLYGDFLAYDRCTIINKLVFKSNDSTKFKGVHDTRSFLKTFFPNRVFICINLGDKKDLYNKMSRVIYVFNSKMEVINAFCSAHLAGVGSTISEHLVNKHLKSGELAPDGNYYIKGSEAVKLILSQGHGTAGDFKPE
jgi:hypothetical protein